jgi:thiol-disulfide isomerase/thioredoxin
VNEARAGSNLRFIAAALVVAAVAAGYFGKRYLDARAAAGMLQPLAEAPAAPAATAPAAATPAEPGAEEAELDKLSTRAGQPVPDTLPGFVLKDRDGKSRKLADWSGRPLIVNYWATWCPPCRREIPLLKRLRAQSRPQSVEVIGIAVDFRDDVLKYAAKEQIDYPLLIGEEDGLAAVAAVGMQPAFPFTVFADRQQRILAVKIGELHEDEALLILAAIDRVDAGKQGLAAAKDAISEGLKSLAAQRAAKGQAPIAATTS